MFKKLLSATLLALFLTSCSLTPFDVLTPKPSVEVNAAVGKNVEQEKSLAKIESGKVETNQEAETISNDTTTTVQGDSIQNIVNGMTWWEKLIAIVCIGAALPSFKEMYQGVKVVVGDILQTFIVYPAKSIADFLLKLKG